MGENKFFLSVEVADLEDLKVFQIEIFGVSDYIVEVGVEGGKGEINFGGYSVVHIVAEKHRPEQNAIGNVELFQESLDGLSYLPQDDDGVGDASGARKLQELLGQFLKGSVIFLPGIPRLAY